MVVPSTRPCAVFVVSLLAACLLATSVSPAAADPEYGRRRPEGQQRLRDYNRYNAPDRRGGSLGADWSAHQEDARRGVREGRLTPLSQILMQIRRRTPGRQLDAGLENDGGRPVYRVRWATMSGRRIDYIVDAESGRILWQDSR